MNKLVCWIFIIAGAYSLICSAFNFDWYFNGRKARVFVETFGRTAARILYSVLGAVLLILGISFLI